MEATVECRGECGRTLPLSEFWPDPSKTAHCGVAYFCKNCDRNRNTQAQQRKRERESIPCLRECGNLIWPKKNKSGICRSCGTVERNVERSMSPQGKRGRHTRKDNGYVLLSRYTYHRQEHREVMAHHKGRPLFEYENVHHKNGRKNDNNISNLELWTKPQPCGQRVQDLVQWVLENYREEVLEQL